MHHPASYNSTRYEEVTGNMHVKVTPINVTMEAAFEVEKDSVTTHGIQCNE